MGVNGASRPVFNTTLGPNDDVVVVAMNKTMATLLADFVDDVEDVEPQIMAFRHSLRYPGDKKPPKQNIGNADVGSFVRMQGVSGCEILIIQPEYEDDEE